MSRPTSLREPTSFESSSLLNNKEFAPTLKEHFGIDFNEADLNKSLQVIHMLNACLTSFKGVSYEQIKNMAQQEISEPHFSSSIEFLEQMAFEIYVRKLLKDLEYSDFGMRDLLKPEPNRIKRLLQHIVNFSKSSQAAFIVKKDCENTMDESLRLKLGLEEKLTQHNQLLKDTLARQKEEESLAKKLKEENVKFEQETNTLRKTFQQGEEALIEIKKEKQESDKLVEGKVLEVKVAKEEVELSKKCIIDDPQKMRAGMSRLRNKVNAGLGQVLSTKERMRANIARTEGLAAIPSEIENSNKLLNELKQLRKTAVERKRNLPALEDTTEKKKEELKTKNLAIQDMEQRLLKQKEKLEKFNSLHHQRHQQLLEQLEESKKRYEECTQEGMDFKLKLDELKKECMDFVTKTQETSQWTEKELSEQMNGCIELRQKTEHYVLGLQKMIESTSRLFVEQKEH